MKLDDYYNKNLHEGRESDNWQKEPDHPGLHLNFEWKHIDAYNPEYSFN